MTNVVDMLYDTMWSFEKGSVTNFVICEKDRIIFRLSVPTNVSTSEFIRIMYLIWYIFCDSSLALLLIIFMICVKKCIIGKFFLWICICVFYVQNC